MTTYPCFLAVSEAYCSPVCTRKGAFFCGLFHNAGMRKKSNKAFRARVSRKIGLPPGALVYVGKQSAPDTPEFTPTISIIEYQEHTLQERTLTLNELSHFSRLPSCQLWLNVHGVHDPKTIEAIGRLFNLHPLVLEDILNTQQRPKIDEYPDYLFLETRNFYYESASLSANSEQISLVAGSDFLLSFQERSTGIFSPIRERLRAEHSHIRSLGSDYLCYALLDTIVDRHFHILETIGDDSDALEHALFNQPTQQDLAKIHQLKRVAIELRRSVWPLREVINHLIRNERAYFKAQTVPYLRDIYDHTVNFIESLESIRDSLSGMMDIYMASVSQRVNLELRALTVVAMLLMPATLIAGILGMNFDNIPWIHTADGFWYALIIMTSIALAMALLFWRRQWLSSRKPEQD